MLYETICLYSESVWSILIIQTGVGIVPKAFVIGLWITAAASVIQNFYLFNIFGAGIAAMSAGRHLPLALIYWLPGSCKLKPLEEDAVV